MTDLNYGLLDTISVAISYSSNTNNLYQESVIDIIKSFRRKRRYNISIYLDRGNIGGDRFDSKIIDNFKKADIIICLVSNGFIKNEYILDKEKPIIKSHAKWYRWNKKVVPIIITRTDNYPSTWLGRTRVTTLPSKDAPKRPYSSYSNEEYARSLVEEELDKIFSEYNDKYVLPRIRYRKKPKIRGLLLTAVLILLLLFGWKAYKEMFLNSEPRIPKNDPIEWYNPDRPIVKIYPKGEKQKEDPDIPEQYGAGNSLKPPSYVIICNSKSSMSTAFPRDLSMYEYYGKEDYGIYESCQGINKEGYKPCKRKRRWYIINESKGLSLKLNVDREVHKDIYAIRPLLNDVAEVYYHDGESMYLEFCVSLEDGKKIE